MPERRPPGFTVHPHQLHSRSLLELILHFLRASDAAEGAIKRTRLCVATGTSIYLLCKVQVHCNYPSSSLEVAARARSMALGRGSASNGAVVLGAAVLLIAFLLLSSGPALTEAAKYTVGDYGGWKFNVVGWAKGKTFRAGDVLEFKYNAAVHDVAAVDAAAYRGCVLPKGKKALRSGHDKVKLVKGTHYFICTVRGHCQANMKIAVRVI